MYILVGFQFLDTYLDLKDLNLISGPSVDVGKSHFPPQKDVSRIETMYSKFLIINEHADSTRSFHL